ncbi:MAG: hypothetical protein QXV05_04005 [Candidatus Korarchaeum sp.]
MIPGLLWSDRSYIRVLEYTSRGITLHDASRKALDLYMTPVTLSELLYVASMI